MSDKLKAADAMAKAVREYLQPYLVKLNPGEKINKTRLRIAVSAALAAYEAEPAERCDDCDPSFLDCWNAKGPKLGEDLHGNEDWARVRPEVQLKDALERVAVLEKALARCDECLNEDIISAAIIKAENKGRSFAIDRDCRFIDHRCKEKKEIIKSALAAQPSREKEGA